MSVTTILLPISSSFATTLEKYDPSVRIRLRFLVTSRPEPHLLKFFTKLHTPSFDLSTVDPADRENDIRIFLKDRLRNMATSAPDWQKEPKEEDIRLLAKISGGGLCCSTYRRRLCRFRRITEFSASKNAPCSSSFGTRRRVRLVLDTIVQENLSGTSFGPLSGQLFFSFTPLSRQALADLLHVEICAS